MSEQTNAARSGGRTVQPQGPTGRRYATQGTAALRADALAPARSMPESMTPRLRVAPPAPISAPRVPFIAVVIGLVLAGVFGILLINTRTNENAFQIARMQDNQKQLDNQQQAIEGRLAGYKNPGNLEAAARRLGLVMPEQPAYLRLPDGKIIGVPKPGTGRPAVTAQDGAAAPAGDAANGVVGTGSVQDAAVRGGTAASAPAAVSPGSAQTGVGATVPGTGR